jgi:hypothetical protein
MTYTYTHPAPNTPPPELAPMEIEVDFRDVYGKTVAYPSCDKARIFSALTGTTTLTPEALKHIIGLGYSVRIKQQPDRYQL